MRSNDGSSDLCSVDRPGIGEVARLEPRDETAKHHLQEDKPDEPERRFAQAVTDKERRARPAPKTDRHPHHVSIDQRRKTEMRREAILADIDAMREAAFDHPPAKRALRSEEHTSELQSLMRISYAVFCLKKKNKQKHKP